MFFFVLFVDGYRNRFKGKEDNESVSSSTSPIAGKSDKCWCKFSPHHQKISRLSYQKEAPSNSSNLVICSASWFRLSVVVECVLLVPAYLAWPSNRVLDLRPGVLLFNPPPPCYNLGLFLVVGSSVGVVSRFKNVYNYHLILCRHVSKVISFFSVLLILDLFFFRQGSVSGEESTASRKSHKRKASRAASPAGEHQKPSFGSNP